MTCRRFDEVEQKIQARYAKAKAMSELNDTSVESRMLEVEQATANVEAQSRLDSMRQELGIDPAGRGDHHAPGRAVGAVGNPVRARARPRPRG